MKTSTQKLRSVALLALGIGAASGAFVFAADKASPPATRLVNADSPEVADIRRLGESAINRLAGTLLQEVATATAKGGPENAVDVCHLKALPVTRGTVAGLPRITEVKRTSLKLRSPANAPDEAEQRVLDHVDRLLKDGERPPGLLIQRVEGAGETAHWRVYKPVAVIAQCLACHGDPADQSAALRAKLQAHYPDDQAVGYNQGDWRGVIRVSVADAPPAK